MEAIKQPVSRIVWIDWMKTIGIYLIVLGHFFSVGEKYVYVFNGPLFFVLSGFLSKKETDNKLFWKKLWYNFVVPMLLICLLNFLINVGETYAHGGAVSVKSVGYFWFQALIGLQSSLGTCWFIYSLVIIKIIYQYTPKGAWSLLLVVLFAACAYGYNQLDLNTLHPILRKANAAVAVFVTYPCFIIGSYLRSYKDQLNKYQNVWGLGTLLVVSLLVVFLCGIYNGDVRIYICGFGGNFLLYLIGFVAGTAFIYSICKFLSDYHTRWMSLAAKGTILIMGFHPWFIPLCRLFFPTPSLLDYVLSVLIVAFFLPITVLADKYFPLILGKLRK